MPTILPKGAHTRQTIIQEARDILNLAGINITIDVIAREMGVSKSRISNHFPTKDSLFIAILAEYEKELAKCVEKLKEEGFYEHLQGYLDGLSQIMDIQYKYRCGFIYLNVLSPSQHELKAHIESNYTRTIAAVKQRIVFLCDLGILNASILESSNWASFLFVYVNLLTQWVVHLYMYDSAKSYDENKKVYIMGIVRHLYLPYLTEKGKSQLAALKM